ncbi:piRNA biogenesis protein EXD1-like [Bufo bufo]|uniref:piRNA biogenesis protein EXD1-like n=1 Tax=Bufo bufo TaxID=8384 RepID=UPI001ABDDF0C|nr:piRNA biogenesis protein EXD1-like [Bufo bufo]
MDSKWISARDAGQMGYRSLSRIIGRRVTVTMTYGRFQGTLVLVDRDQTVMLSKVTDLTTNITKPGVQLFFASEILSVDLQKKDEEVCPELESSDQPITRERDKAAPLQMVDEARDVERRLTVSHTDNIQAIETAVSKLEVNFTVIDQLRTKFGNAIEDIQCQPVIGLASAGSNVCRQGSLYSLQVATKKHVFLFDIAVLGESVFKWGLKAVLEDKSVLKVVHDCRRLSDCLFHQYGTVLNNVFDTQVADVFLFHMTTGGFLPQCANSFVDCLAKHLNLDPSKTSFLPKTQEIMKDNLLWSLHPMSSPLQKALALEASYVLSLYLTMANSMMADFTSIVAAYLRVYEHNDATNWLQIPGTKLPQQFRQLKDLQRIRKEKALKDYVIDENGLLAKPGSNLKISGQDQVASDMKIQMSQDPQRSTVDVKKDQWAAGMKPVNEIKSEGRNKEPQITPCETRAISQSPPDYPVCYAAHNPVYLRFPGPQVSRQAQVPVSSHGPTAGSRVRMSAARLLAKTTYTWCS